MAIGLLTWDGAGKRLYETGVDQGVLYIPDGTGAYANGVAWNGLVGVTESPTGAEANAQYADNIKYLNLYSVEQYEATLEAFTYPDEWHQFDGNFTSSSYAGVVIGQQPRKTFGLSYRTKLGNDLLGDDYAYKLHLCYGLKASPSERAYTTINDSPSPITFSWSLMSTAASASGRSPTSLLTIDSSKASANNLTALNNMLYGTAGTQPSMPTPDAVVTLMSANTVTPVTAANPVAAATGLLTIPSSPNVVYKALNPTTGIYSVITTGTALPGVTGNVIFVTAEPAAPSGGTVSGTIVTGAIVYVMSSTSDTFWAITKLA